MAPTRRRAALAASGHPSYGSPLVPSQPRIDVTSALRQRLMWVNTESSQIDLVEATRLSSAPVSIPPDCGLCYIETGVRFDPDEYPDLARKTQEKLATRIIESGKSREHGRTIKVKEYSSRQRKRIRFACSREECNVTFQINFDSKKGHWFMKRNKGSFEHTCSALRTAVQAAQRQQQLEHQQQQKMTPMCVPITPQTPALKAPLKPANSMVSRTNTASPAVPHVARSRSRSLKRCSPEPSPAEEGTPKKSKTLTLPPTRSTSNRSKAMAPKVSLSSYEVTPRAECSTKSLSSSEEKDKSVHCVPQSITVDESKKQTPKIRNRDGHAYHTEPIYDPHVAGAFDEPLSLPPFLPSKEDFAKSTKGLLRPSPSSVAVSIYSQNVFLNDEEKNSKAAYPPPVETRMGGFPENEGMFCSTPPSPPKVMASHAHPNFAEDMFTSQEVSFPGHMHADETLVDPYNSKPAEVALMNACAEQSNLPPLMAASSSSHASLLEAEDIEDFPTEGETYISATEPCLGPFLYTLENPNKVVSNGNSASGQGVAAGQQEVGHGHQEGTAENEERSPQHVETLSHKLSLCSLLVSPLDMVDLWTKQVGTDNNNDDNSSISTNWSVSDFRD